MTGMTVAGVVSMTIIVPIISIIISNHDLRLGLSRDGRTHRR